MFALPEGLNSKLQSQEADARGFRIFRIRNLFLCGKPNCCHCDPEGNILIDRDPNKVFEWLMCNALH